MSNSKLAFKPGDIIQSAKEPFVKSLDRRFKGLRCDNCFEPPSGKTVLSACSGCMINYYCSTSCQKTDWKYGHKIECSSNTFKEYHLLDNLSMIFSRVFRLYALLKLKPELADKHVPIHFIDQHKCFNDVRKLGFDKFEEEKKFGDFSMNWDNICSSMNKENLEVDKDLLLELFYNCIRCSFHINDKLDDTRIGFALYTEAAFFGHSCSPNALYSTNGTTFSVRAIAEIQPGEEVNVAVVDLLDTRDIRHGVLFARFGIWCQCKMCATGEDIIDYKKLLKLIRDSREATEVVYHNGTNTLAYYLGLHNEILGLLRKIYAEYHNTITEQYLRLFAVLKNYKTLISKKRMVKFALDIKHHVLITYGDDSGTYKKFQQQLVYMGLRI